MNDQNLNPQQKEAATHHGGPLLIIAGAGSGKTKTLTSRIAHLIATGTPPERILAVTFTNKAAAEMRERVERLLSAKRLAMSGLSVGTFHSWGARMLKRHAVLLGRSSAFSIFDEDDALRISKDVVKKMDLDTERYNPSVLRWKISKIKDELVDVGTLRGGDNHADAIAIKVFDNYETALKNNNAFDFDDLIEKPVRLFESHPALLAQYQERYAHVLVDEYQDINTAQYRLIKLLAAKHKNLSVVGDDAQSIYKFRGSDFRIFLNFDRDWPGAKVVKLEENYRSTANIITAASHVISNNKEQKPKTLWTKNPTGARVQIVGVPDQIEEAYAVTGNIQKLFRDPNADPQIAILYRTNAQSRPIEQALLQAGIPYRIYGGLRFYDRMEIKDVIAALRYAHNPKDRVSLARIEKNFGKRESAFLAAELPRLAGELKLLELIGFFLENTKYMEYLERAFKNARERVENVKELITFAGTFNHLGLADFLEQVSLVASTDLPNGKPEPKKLARGVVTLMTIHAAKGLEFNQVFVAGANEGLIPHEQSFTKAEDIEEERRLMYVAMTRARHQLTLMYYNVPSRFLYEIPAELTEFKTIGNRFRDELPDEDEQYITYD
ncbi:MAG: UvrD-helicase domain-containing protein [Candidatus Harrisonbacteria bacterium]|nr:UvrD-helicase domain-containing protein [Candidatus Harrisonbacteria bacterium]